jgi:DNA gyrase subunit A
MAVTGRNGPLVASFPVDDADEIMLVTDGGQVIRVPVDRGPDNRISIIGRNSQGVRILRTAEDEKVVSVEHIPEPEENGHGENGDVPEEDEGDAEPPDGGGGEPPVE